MAVVIETTIGDFTIDLFTDERPQTCRNFLKLCKIKYYNWSLFHTIQSNFIAQAGDPTGTGKGGESVYGMALGEHARYYAAEQMPKIRHETTGLISMVNCGDNMLGSQFFITLAPKLQSLDKEHCVFGRITEGLEIVLKFNAVICDNVGRPYQDIRISHTVILEDPYEDLTGLVIPDQSPGPTKEFLTSERIRADEVINDTEGMTTMEIMEMQRDKEAKARATILEIVGDIPDAEMAPPENVLFVCKLNPVTNDDDLEIIFSRFGKIIGCEVIRDRQSGDSLQYAFIEFSNRKSCEDAYFKMDNVLIDDRRIHVDFSQSVAKMRWRGKGKGIKYYDNEEQKHNEGDSKEKNITRDSKYTRDRPRYRRNENKSERDRSKNNEKYRENQSLDRHNKWSNSSNYNDKEESRQRNKMIDRRDHRRERSRDRKLQRSREHKHNDEDIRTKKKKVSSSGSDGESDDHTNDIKKHKHSKKHKSENTKKRRKKHSSDSDDESTTDDTSSDDSKPSRKRKNENKKRKKKKNHNIERDDGSSSEHEKRSSHKKKHVTDRSKDQYVKKNEHKYHKKSK